MLPGQRAEIRIDAYPDLKLNGHVESLGAGTGSEFAILPAQNANGNWVKVTQRVPVRIAIDERSPRPLLAGLSATITVFTDDRRSEEHTSELQSLMRISYAVFCLKKKNSKHIQNSTTHMTSTKHNT